MWVLVEFLNDPPEVAVVPKSWLINEKTCYWPPWKNTERVNRLVMKNMPACTEWEKYAMRILRNNEGKI
jgi:hypothetical protein